METKLHTLSASLKVLMFQIPLITTKKGNTFEVGPTMCVSSTNKGKTQVGWVATIGGKCKNELM
jgi:hypothetical protein